MTLSIVWVRTVSERVRELVFCSDSRLSCGRRFDHGAKLFAFPRLDCGLAFAGGADWAYPMIVALVRSAEIHTPSLTRAINLVKYRTHLLSVLDQMQSKVHSYARGENIPDITLLFGGWDWQDRDFKIWLVSFDPKAGRFSARKPRERFGTLGSVAFAGDDQFVADARIRLRRIAQERHGKSMRDGAFAFEPLEVLRDILLDVKATGPVGGAPQVMKVHQHTNARIVGVQWITDGEPVPHFAGRPLLSYERANGMSVMDLNTFRTEVLGVVPTRRDEGGGKQV